MKINQFFTIASILALALTVGHSVSAADLLRGGSLKDSPAEYTDIGDSAKGWTGPYVGIGGGYEWQDIEESHVEVYPYAKAKRLGKRSGIVTTTEDGDGFLLTGRLGYDWQRGPIVWGPFGEVDWLGGGGDADFAFAIGGRLGWLLTPGWLAYINGGGEWRNGTVNDSVSPFFGGGMEWILRDSGTDKWTLAIEPRVTFAADDNTTLLSTVSADDITSVRLLLNRRF